MNKELSSNDWTDIFARLDATGPSSQARLSNEATTATVVASDSPPPNSAEHACGQANSSQADIPSGAPGEARPADASTSGGLQVLEPTSTAPTATSGGMTPQEPTPPLNIAADDRTVILPSHQSEIVAAEVATQHDIDFDVMLGELERVFAGIRRLESSPLTRPKAAPKPSFFH